MYRDELKSLLERRSFESFAISTHDGAVRYIRHPECAALGASVLMLIEPATDRSERIAFASISSIATFEGQAV